MSGAETSGFRTNLDTHPQMMVPAAKSTTVFVFALHGACGCDQATTGIKLAGLVF